MWCHGCLIIYTKLLRCQFRIYIHKLVCLQINFPSFPVERRESFPVICSFIIIFAMFTRRKLFVCFDGVWKCMLPRQKRRWNEINVKVDGKMCFRCWELGRYLGTRQNWTAFTWFIYIIMNIAAFQEVCFCS